MPRFYSILLSAALLAGFHTSRVSMAFAQSHELRGTVVSHGARTLLAGAVVRIDELGTQTRTDFAGRYSLAALPAGRYAVSVRRLGHVSRVDTVVIGPEQSTTLDVELAITPIRLATVEVLRDRTEIGRHADAIPGSVHVVRRDDVAGHARLVDDVHQVLRQVPGVVVQEEDGYGLRPNIGMRGTGSERSAKITLMEDGVLIAPAPYAAPSAYYFPVVGRMEAIEVRKGTSEIKYGPRTIGGALNLVSSSIPDDLTFAADLAGGGESTRKVNARLGDAFDHGGWLIETYQLESDGFKRVDGGSPAGFDLENYVAKLRLQTDPGADVYQAVEFKLGYYDERSDETYLGLTDRDFGLDPLRRYAASQLDVMNAEHRQVQARHFIKPGERFDVTTTAYRNRFARNWYKLQTVLDEGLGAVLNEPERFPDAMAVLRGGDSAPDALRVRANNRDYVAEGIQTVFGAALEHGSVEHQIEIGARYHRDAEDRFQHEDAFRMVSGSMIETAAGAPGSQSNRVSHARAASWFVQDQIAVGRWLVTPGLRFERIRLTREDYDPGDLREVPVRVRTNVVTAWVPGLGASYALRRGWRVFGGVHRGFAPPGPGTERDTEAERSVNYEIGMRFNTPAARMDLVGFFNDYRNVLGAATLASGETGSGDQFNGGAVDVTGVELSLSFDPLRWRGSALSLPLAAAWTYTSATFRTDFSSAFDPWGDVSAGDRLPYVPALQMHGSVGLEGHRWAINAGANYTGAVRTLAGRGPIPLSQRVDAALVVNASGEYGVGSLTTVFAGVQNLFDRRYVAARRPAGLRPGLPRTIVAGVKIRQ